MANCKKYLEKVVIYSDDSLVGEYRPLIDDKKNCQIISLTRNFKDVDINLSSEIKKYQKSPIFTPKSLLKSSKQKKQKLSTVELKNSELKLFKSQRFDEYVIFFKQKADLFSNEVISLKLSRLENKRIKMNSKKRRKKCKPKNYIPPVGICNIFEERVRKELQHWVEKFPNISANAVFRTNSVTRPKMFLSQDLKTDYDTENFMQHMKKFNSNVKKVVNHNFPLSNVQAFVVINKNKKVLYLELTETVRKCINKTLQTSKYVDFDKKQYIDAELLNIKLEYLRYYKTKYNKNYDSLLPQKSSLVTINEYTVENMYDLIQEYEENIAATNNILIHDSFDGIMKETYKMLVELQLNAVQQCNQLFLNYFTYKNTWPQNKMSIFTDYIKQNFNLLHKLQNRAVENSVSVNKKIQKVNKFLNTIRDQTILRCRTNSHLKLGTSASVATISIPRGHITSVSDYRLVKKTQARQEYEFKMSVNEFDTDSDIGNISRKISQVISKKETEVQTSTIQIVRHTLQIEKCCSPMDIPILVDRKNIQTDISVNKNTSFDFGGKQIQICKRKISLKMKPSVQQKVNRSQPVLQTTEKIIHQTSKSDATDISRLNKQPEKEIIKNVLTKSDTTDISRLNKQPEKQIINNDIKETVQEKIEEPVKQFESKDTETDVPVVPTQTKPEIEKIKITGSIDALFSRQEQIINLVSPSEREILDKLIEYKDYKVKKQFESISNNVEESKVTTNQTTTTFNEPSITKSSESNITLNIEQKIQKLDTILRRIKEESQPRPDDIKSEKNPKHKILYKIQDTLEMVKDRFEKNSQILRKVTDIKENYIVKSNIQSLMDTGGLKGDFPGKPKFLKATPEPINYYSQSSYQTKADLAINLNNSLQMLKHLNNSATYNPYMGTNANLSGTLNELEESILLQRKYMPKLRVDKMQLTLTPIKNFIETNKNLTRNYGRYAVRKKSSLTPCINSKHIVDMTKNKRYRRRTSVIKSPKPSTANIPKNLMSIHTIRETVVPKIFRPLSKPIPESPKLSDLSLTDVTPLQPEYPRKDNLKHIEIEKTYLYKLLNNSFSEKNLEPTVKCSNVNCESCAIIDDEKKTEKRKSRKNSRKNKQENPETTQFFKKINSDQNKTLIWEKMDWNTEITVQPDHDFDFNQYMDDPTFKNQQNLTVFPVSVNYDNNQPKNLPPKSFEASLRNFSNAVKKAVPLTQIRQHPNQGLRSITSINKNLNDPSKIQRSIQQALIRNQEKFKFIQHTPQKTSRHRPIPNLPTPKIISSNRLTNTNRLAQVAVPSRRTEFSQRKPSVAAYKEDNVFDRKYKVSKVPNCPTNEEDVILNSISKTVKRSQDDMQRYIELVEQKFVKTFSLPETEKASAYTNLETEIKEMLQLLNTTKEKKNIKPEALLAEITKNAPNITTSKLQQKPKSSSSNQSKLSINKPKMKPAASNTSLIVLKEPINFSTNSEMAVDESDKKKTTDDSKPTICTDSIIFSESLAAIASKQNVQILLPRKSSSILKKSSVNLKFSCSVRSVKKVRFKLEETKISKSESSVSLSTDDYSTYYEETISDFSSDNDFTKNLTPYIDVSVLLYSKLTYFIEHPTLTTKTYFVITNHEQINIKDSIDILFEPENYDVKILCKKNTTDFLEKQSSFGFDDLKPILSSSSRDSLSDFIENCEEIIEATKKLDLQRSTSSPYVLEFLDILSSISSDNVVLKIDIFFQWYSFKSHLEYLPKVSYVIQQFYPIFYENSVMEDFTTIFDRYRTEVALSDVCSNANSFHENIDYSTEFLKRYSVEDFIQIIPTITPKNPAKEVTDIFDNISYTEKANSSKSDFSVTSKSSEETQITERKISADDFKQFSTNIFDNSLDSNIPEKIDSTIFDTSLTKKASTHDFSLSVSNSKSQESINNEKNIPENSTIFNEFSTEKTNIHDYPTFINISKSKESINNERNILEKTNLTIIDAILIKKTSSHDLFASISNSQSKDSIINENETVENVLTTSKEFEEDKEVENKITQTSDSTDIFQKFANELGTISNELNTLYTDIKTSSKNNPDTNLTMLPFHSEREPMLRFYNKNIHQHFSQPNFTNDFLNYRIKFPFDREILKCRSDTLCLDMVAYNQKNRYEPVGQTLILNLQIVNYGRNNTRRNNRKSIRKKCYISPLKNKVKLKAIEMNFDLNKKKLLAMNSPHKFFLIILYITLFSIAFLCMLNYTCE